MIADIIIGIFLVYILACFFVLVFMYQSGPSKFSLDIRILKNTLKNGQVVYNIQQKLPLLYIWIDCHEMNGIDSYVPIEFKNQKQAQNYVARLYENWKSNEGYKVKNSEVVSINQYPEPNDPLRCPHEIVSTEYMGQTYGHCIECDSTVVKSEEGNWKTP